MNTSALLTAISGQWDARIVPQLIDYIRIPAKSPREHDFRPGVHGSQ
jgi:hypothetical protein